jgi:hypothetical protein
MRTNKLLVSLTAFFLTLSIAAQNTFHFGPELGVSISRFPFEKSTTYPLNFATLKVTNRDNTIISPVIGFNGEFITKKIILFSFGLKYQMTGTRSSGNSESISATEEYSETWTEKQTFHKLTLPITTGLRFRTGKVYSAINVGFKPNLFISARYQYDWVKHSSIEPYDQSKVSDFNPLDPQEAVIPAKALLGQFIVGISNYASQNLKISLTACLGGRNYYNEGVPESYRLAYRKFEKLINNDFEFSITYYFE